MKKEEKEKDQIVDDGNEIGIDSLTSDDNDNSNDSNRRIEELNDKYVRLYAEFENYKRRVVKQLSDVKSQTKFSTVKELLDIMDDIHLSRSAMGIGDPMDWIDGASLIFDKLDKYIDSVGIKEEVCDIGTKFDPDKHDCVTVIDMGNDNTGTIIEVIKRGYLIDGKIVKYPKVVVGK